MVVVVVVGDAVVAGALVVAGLVVAVMALLERARRPRRCPLVDPIESDNENTKMRFEMFIFCKLVL